MPRNLRFWSLAGVVAMIGCSSFHSPSADAVSGTAHRRAQQAPAASAAHLVTVRGRDFSVKVYAGNRYSVFDAESRVLAERVTQEELERQLPDVWASIDGALVDDNTWADNLDAKFNFMQENLSRPASYTVIGP